MSHDESRASPRRARDEGPLEHVEPPEETLAADETPTPAWLPLLGIGLGLAALLGWLAAPPAGAARTAPPLTAASGDTAPSAAPDLTAAREGAPTRRLDPGGGAALDARTPPPSSRPGPASPRPRPETGRPRVPPAGPALGQRGGPPGDVGAAPPAAGP